MVGKRFTLADIARRVGKAEATVRHHASGVRFPDEKTRIAYAEQYGVDATSWTKLDEAPSPAPTTQTVLPKKPKISANSSALEEVRSNLAAIDDAITLAKADKSTPSTHLSALFNSKTAAARMLARLTGALDVSESVIIASPPWQRLVLVIIDALRAHPEAAKAVLAAISKYDDGVNQTRAA